MFAIWGKVLLRFNKKKKKANCDLRYVEAIRAGTALSLCDGYMFLLWLLFGYFLSMTLFSQIVSSFTIKVSLQQLHYFYPDRASDVLCLLMDTAQCVLTTAPKWKKIMVFIFSYLAFVTRDNHCTCHSSIVQVV